ncbi:hypothetical protein K461DRAFT_277731 [Myriangium duriaei CBS 260.36]|uniref:Zn(2)-C6 fungal-type domain-containing protein n=1 Tax=Myriangium duriaei CBS 260.36 TaxID=1168546 RepID=A0A9P4MH83_9PEZI|nr:hypothetical protein K461DRAFT_277731 [Myriangium duriaei CBS 260.36]
MPDRKLQENQKDVNYSVQHFVNYWSNNTDMNPGGPAPTPPSTNSSNGASPDHGQFRVVRKRNRIPLSCAPCRHRKLKCNRQHPCDNCTKRGDVASCAYAAPSARKKSGQTSGPNGTPDDMQNRIDRLENLVLSLMTSGQGSTTASAQAAINNARNNSITDTTHSAGASMDQDGESEMQDQIEEDSDVNDVSQGLGVMKVDGSKSIFASDAHWHAILANIAEVKNYYASHKEDYQAQVRRVKATQDDDAPGGSHIFQAPRLSSKDEVLAAFPNQVQADVLVGRYFNSNDPSVSIIHGPTFKKYYDAHWLNPKETPLPFLAKMFACMSLALQSYDRAGDEPPDFLGISMKVSATYRRLTAQALVLADINEPDPQILEALVLHIFAEFGRSRDPESGVITLVSLAVRQAMRMGYHRDPAPHPAISPFQGEIRRRVWMLLRQADLLFSAQCGLPAVLKSEFTDTAFPRNLYDDELYEELQTLPESRPDTEQTPISYGIAKARLAQVFGLITDRLAVVASPITYEEVMHLDNELRQIRGSHPPHLRMRPLRESGMEPPTVTMQRFALELLYLKSQCMLHRRFISRGRESPRYGYSRRTCIDASMDMLSHQATLHHESQPGGRLHSVKWYISSLTTNDFLLAAMIVCLELHHSAEAERSGRKGSTTGSPMSSDLIEERKGEMLEALRHSRTIWNSLRDRSVEAWKASTSIKIMLEKLMSTQQAQAGVPGGVPMGLNGRASYPPLSGIFSNSAVPMTDVERDQGPETAAAMTLGLLSSGGVSPSPQYGQSSNSNPTSAGTGNTPPSNDSRGYPASMAGILNEPMADQQRSGFTPVYSGMDNTPGAPFGAMFGATPSMFEGMNGIEIDWGAWDSFIQGSSLPNHMWPSTVPELPNTQHAAIDPAIEGGAVPTTTAGSDAGATFMGAGTPAAGGMLG